MQTDSSNSSIGQRWKLIRDCLDERQRRMLAAAEAKVIGRGGISQVTAATGLARGTIVAGLQEIENTRDELPMDCALAAPVRTRTGRWGRHWRAVSR
jgi:hypothetical protein